ncbi:MAG TPA: L-histidine N(alpha)-methyltransferase [Verrucomicrobiae bacterium]
MSTAAHVLVHPSQFPDKVRRDLLDSLRAREVNHKFLYEGVGQTHKWLALHQACSPSRTDPDCAAIYERSFKAAAAHVATGNVHLVGLGCGGGQKDARLLALLGQSGKRISYTPADVSTAMVLVARQAALRVLTADRCFPLVLDLATADDVPGLLTEMTTPGQTRLVTFFGMVPNFEPDLIMPRLAALIRPGDFLLFSANLAPGPDYDEGIQRILPLYDNDLTREWLSGFLLGLGVQTQDGDIRFVIEAPPAAGGLKRVAAYYHFEAAREIHVDGETFSFQAGDTIRLFYSYRHTPALATRLLQRHGLQVVDQWVTKSEEEGVFLASPL